MPDAKPLPANFDLDGLTLKSVLVRTGFEIAYLAHDRSTGQDEIVREYFPSDVAQRTEDQVSPLSSDAAAVFDQGLRGFLREAQALSEVSSPAIAPTRRIFEANGTAYVASAPAQGRRLELLLRDQDASTRIDGIERWLWPLLDALKALHDRGIVHCDLCPETILVTDGGGVQVVGFSRARHDFRRTAQAPAIRLRAGFAPIELDDVTLPIGPWTDIYAIGSILARAITGRPAGDAAVWTPAGEIDFSEAAPEAHKLMAMIRQAMAPDPAQRPRSIAAWRAHAAEGTAADSHGPPDDEFIELSAPIVAPARPARRSAWRGSLAVFEVIAAMGAAVSVLAGMAFVLLASGPIPLEFLTPYIERALSPQGSPVNVKIGATKLTWDGWQRPVDVRAQKVQIFNPAGAELATLDEVAVGLSFPALLTGLVAPSSLDIHRPTVRLTRTRDGQFEFGLGDSGGAGDQQPALQQLLDGLLAPPDPQASSGYLERVTIADAALTVDDRMLGTTWRAHDIRIEVVRGEGAVDAEFRTVVPVDGRPVNLGGKLRYQGESGPTQLWVQFADVVPADFARGAPMLERLAALDLPVSGTVEARLLPSGRFEEVRFDVQSDKGRVRHAGRGDSTEIVKARLVGRFEQELSVGIIENLYVDFGGPNISASAAVSNAGASGEARLNIVARRFSVADIGRLWPADLRPDLRGVLLDTVRTGRLDEASVSVVGKADAAGFTPDLKSLRMESRFSGVGGEFALGVIAQDLAGSVKASPDQIEMTVSDGAVNLARPDLPAITDIRGRVGVIPNRRIDLFLSEAKVGGLALSDARLNVAGLDQPAPEVSGDAVLRGPVDRFLQILQKAETGSDAAIDLPGVKGEVMARVLFRFAAGSEFNPNRIQRSAAARITGLAVPAGPLGLAITEGDVTVEYDARDVKLAGQLKVNGAPVAMEMRHTLAGPTKDRLQARFTGTMTDEQRRRLGLVLDRQVSGPVDFDIDVTRADSTTTTANARLKLDRARVTLRPIYWEKLPGIPGSASFTLTTRKGRPTEISEFVASGGGLKAEGRAWLKPGTSDIQRAELDTLQFGGKDGTSVYADFNWMPGNGWKVGIAGEQLNLQPYIEDPDLAFDFPLEVNTQLRRLRLDRERALNDVRMSAAFGGQYWDKVELESKLDNRSELSVRYVPAGDQRDFLVYATDAGTVLQLLTGAPLARDLRGGEMAIRATRDPTLPNTPTEGVVQLRGFSLRDTPTGDRLIRSFAALDLARNLRIAGDDLNFSILEAGFRKAGGRLELKNLMVLSRGLAVNASGDFDFDANRMTMTGYLSPFRSVGQLLDERPSSGGSIASVDKEGLIAYPFAGSGKTDDPDFSIDRKPQSMPAGQLREFARIATGKDRDLSPANRLKPSGMMR